MKNNNTKTKGKRTMDDFERKVIGDQVIARVEKTCRKLLASEKTNLKMGLFYARDDKFNEGRGDVLVGGNLNVKALLDCDEFSLAHDVFQINEYICKDSTLQTFGTMMQCFVPRCGFEKEVA